MINVTCWVSIGPVANLQSIVIAADTVCSPEPTCEKPRSMISGSMAGIDNDNDPIGPLSSGATCVLKNNSKRELFSRRGINSANG